MFHYIKNNIKYIIIHLLILGFMYVILLRETYVDGFNPIGWVKDTANSAGGAFKGAVNKAGDALKDAGGQITAAGAATLAGIRQAADGVVYNATAAYNTVKNGATQIGGFVNGLISGLLSALLNGLAKAVARLLTAFNLALSSVNDVLDQATHFEQNVVNSIKNSTTYTSNSAGPGFKFSGGLFNKREGFSFKNIMKDVKDAANDVGNAVGNPQNTGSTAEMYADGMANVDSVDESYTARYLNGEISEDEYKKVVSDLASRRRDIANKYRIEPTTKYVLWEDTPEGRAKLAATKAAAKAVAKTSAERNYNKLIAKADSMMTNLYTMFQTGQIPIKLYRSLEIQINDERIKARNALDNFDQSFEQYYQYSG